MSGEPPGEGVPVEVTTRETLPFRNGRCHWKRPTPLARGRGAIAGQQRSQSKKFIGATAPRKKGSDEKSQSERTGWFICGLPPQRLAARGRHGGGSGAKNAQKETLQHIGVPRGVRTDAGVDEQTNLILLRTDDGSARSD